MKRLKVELSVVGRGILFLGCGWCGVLMIVCVMCVVLVICYVRVSYVG